MVRKIGAIVALVTVFLVGCSGNGDIESTTSRTKENSIGKNMTDDAEVDIDLDKKYSADEDSDYDGLSDLEEVEDYKTDPEKEDTDGDGVEDLVEININTNPCEYNEIFSIKLTSEEVTEYNLVSLEVDVELNKEQILSTDIKALTSSDNFLLSPMLAGYLGWAYRYIVDGEVDSVLTFRYNTEVYGPISDEFQPCIYSFDEDTQLFTEIASENIEEGAIQGKVNKEGIYILLNKIEHDKLWGLDLGK